MRFVSDGDTAGLEGKFSERFECDALDLRGVAGRAGIASSSLVGARLRSPVDG